MEKVRRMLQLHSDSEETDDNSVFRPENDDFVMEGEPNMPSHA